MDNDDIKERNSTTDYVDDVKLDPNANENNNPLNEVRLNSLRDSIVANPRPSVETNNIPEASPPLSSPSSSSTSQPNEPYIAKEPEFYKDTNVSSNDQEDALVYSIKWITFNSKLLPIIMQNENGPCPIIAIANVLFLRQVISLPGQIEFITGGKLINILSDCLLASQPKDLTSEEAINYESNVSDAFSLFPKLQTGLDVNVKFSGPQSFEYTSSLNVFDLFKIALYHGWLVDPVNDPDLANRIADKTYNQLVEMVINYKAKFDASNEASTVDSQEGLIIEQFLDNTASQLTFHGLTELTMAMENGQLAVLFRNNHFNTIYKRKDRIYVLVTDLGLLQEDLIVWEVLYDVYGNTEFVDGNFKLFMGHKEQPYNDSNVKKGHEVDNVSSDNDKLISE